MKISSEDAHRQSSKSMTDSWRFRISVPQDVDRMFDVWYASVVATHDFLTESDLVDICALVREYLPTHAFDVAVDDEDRVVGFMAMTPQEISALFLHPDYRSKGLGRAFVEMAIARSAQLEVEVNEQNLQAVGFYKAMGFVVFKKMPLDDDGRPYPILRMRL